MKRSAEVMENEPIFRAAISDLYTGHPKEAAKKFQALIDRKLDFRDLRSYRIWSGLKCDRTYKELTLDMVPPEERHSAAYTMTKGVYFRTRRQYEKSMECFRAALALDPSLNIAKHEIKRLKMEIERRGANKDLFTEVTSVVENLFGKIGRKGA
jgi:tetratricopeptide (TPR) repeat protein